MTENAAVCSGDSATVKVRTRVPAGKQPTTADHRGRTLPALLYRRPLYQQNSAKSSGLTVISLPSCVLSTRSKSLYASNTSFSRLPTKSLQPPNLHTFITSSLFNVLAALALHLLLALRPR